MKRNLQIRHLLFCLFALLLFEFNPATTFAQDYSIFFKSGKYIPEAGALKFFVDKKKSSPCLFNGKYYVLMQFNKLPGDKEKDILKSNGIILNDYIPNNTYYAIIPSDINIDIFSSINTRAISSIPPVSKLDTLLTNAHIPAYAIKVPGMVDLIVQYFPGIDETAAENAIVSAGGDVISHSDVFSHMNIRIGIDKIQQLASMPWIKWIAPIPPPHTGFNSVGRPLHRDNVLQSTLKNQRGLTGYGINSSIADEGDISIHIDLRARLHHLFSGLALHSTHCSGTIAGAGLRDPYGEGMAPRTQLYSWSFNGSIIDTLDGYAALYNISLSSNSFGYAAGYYGGYDAEAYDVDYEVHFNHKNLSQIWAAGNDGASGSSTVSSGGNSAKDNITIGALYEDAIAAFSSTGPVSDGRIKPEVCALGGSVYSTSFNNDYTFLSGTSMATPGTTGTLALIYQRFKQLNGGKYPSARLIKAVVCNTAYDMGNPGPDYTYGFGRIDALMAVRALEKNNYVEDSVKTGDTITTYINIPANLVQVKILLNWDDYPGATSASTELVNNLQLRLVASKKTTYLPFVLNPSSPSSNAKTGIDSINVVKQIVVDTLRKGKYKVEVIGKYVPYGPQHFALTWEMDTNSLEVTSPLGGESFEYKRPYINDTSLNYYTVPFSGDTNFVDTNQMSINWEASGFTNPFTISFSGDSGSSWTKIGTAASNVRDFYWLIPDTVTTAGLIKITNGSYSSISDSTFTILQSPTILSTKACTSRVQIIWGSSRKATSYQILRLQGDTIWKVLATVPDTSFLDSTVKSNTEYWYTVRAVRYNAVSPRAIATEIVTSGTNCFALLDAGISAIDSPYFGFCHTTQNIYAHLYNYGAKTLTSATINWSINGTTQTAYKWTGSLGTGGSVSVNIGSSTFSSSGTYDIKAWTTSPNGGTDQNHSNDSFNQANIKQAMSGTYTIGASGANYKTFKDAVAAISKGICGPVVFNVKNGTYTEQVSITKIPGSSPVNTVTFQSASGDSTKVLLEQSTTSASSFNAILYLDSTQWLIFKQITLELTGTTSYYGACIEVENSYNNTITNCRLLCTKGAAYNASQYFIYSYETPDTANVFSNNLMKYASGSYGIYWYGPSAAYNNDNIFVNNTIDSFYGYYYPVYFLFQNGLTFSGNSVIDMSGTYPDDECFFYACTQSTITKNKIVIANAYSTSGLYIYGCSGTSASSPTLVANNFIAVAGSGTLYAGIYSIDNSYINLYFNNVNITNTSSGAVGLYNYSTLASGVNNVENNCSVNKGGGEAVFIYYYDINKLNYNNWYVPSTSTLGTWYTSSGGTGCSTLSAWKTASSQDSKSLSVDPKYFSATDLHVKNTSLEKAGIAISGISTDIDGKIRNNPPTIGADELNPQQIDAGVNSIDTPASSFCAGSTRVSVTIKDFSGASTLSSVSINWEVDGTTQTAHSWTGTLSAGSKKAGIYLGSYTFASGSHTIKAWTSSPNGGADSNHANDTSTLKITVNALPLAKTGSNQSVCSGASTTIGATAISGDTYSWTSKPSGYTSTDASPSVSPTTATTYYLTEKVATTGCSKSDSVEITVNPLPKANTGSNQSVCDGSSTTIGSTAISGDTYSWTSKPSGYSSTDANPSSSPTTTTTYYLTEKITSTGCSKSDSVVITVNPLPADNAGSNQTICSGNSVKLGASSTSGHTYSWTSYPSGFANTGSNPTVSPTITTTYYLTESITATGCSKTDSTIVTVNQAPKAYTGSNQLICAGNGTTIGGTAVSGDTYSWTSSPTGFTSTASNPSISPTITTTYYLTESAGTSCSKTDTVVISVNLSPANNAGSNQTICSGNTVQLGASSASGHTYSWTSNPSGFTNTGSSPSVSPTITTTYYLTESITSSGCSKTDSAIVTVNPAPKAYTGNNQSICSGSGTIIGGTAVSGDTYSWTSSPTGFTSTASNPSISPTTTTSYYLTESAGASCSKTDTVLITVNPLPQAITGSNQAICDGNSAKIGGTSVPGDLYSWTSKPVGFTSTSAAASPAPTVSTTYYLTETTTAKCSKTDSVAITVNPLPGASFTSKLNNDTVFFTPNNLSYTGYEWNFGDKSSGVKDTSSLLKPSHIYANNGVYITTLAVTDKNGCTASDTGSVTINLTGVSDIKIANVDVKIIPNPFKSNVLIEYSLPENSEVRAAVYDITGQEIAELFSGNQDAGMHQYNFDAAKYNAAAGMYFLRMVINGSIVNMKMVKE